MIALGDVVGADVPTEGYLKIDPTVLTKRYGMLSPRALVAAGRQVPVVIRNPLPVNVKLFRCSEIGTACFAEVDDSQAAEMRPGRLCDPSPDSHPVNALELGYQLPDARLQKRCSWDGIKQSAVEMMTLGSQTG
jgi:hypothetical protein